MKHSQWNLIDMFVWVHPDHSNMAFVARNNTSRWMERLIFHSDGQKEMASVDVCVCQHLCTYIPDCVWASVCACVCELDSPRP